jgi:ribosomal protein S18 acetylase RimI-like enzyme
MRDNPSSVALFGDDPVRRVRVLEPVYHWVLASLQRPSLVARRRGLIVGIAALAPPDRCFFRQTAARQKTVQIGRTRVGATMPSVPRHLLLPLLRLGPGALARLSTWGEAGLKHDPQERHQHVELVVVEAALQGLGIGQLMMEELCREMDELPDVAYLETDKQENVRFYERFGFQVADEATVLETRNWYMQRRQGA